MEQFESSKNSQLAHGPSPDTSSDTALPEKEDSAKDSSPTHDSYPASLEAEHHHQNEDCYSRLATAKEIKDLPHVMTSIPATTWMLVFIGSASAFARYGATTPFQNYIQNPPGNPKLPGALNLGQSKATIITSIFSFFIFFTPLPFGILSDAWLGRYRTMILSLALLLIGYVLLVVTSLPMSLQNNVGLGGLIASMLFIGLGQGGLSAIMFVFIGDQIPDSEPVVKRSKDKFVVVSRKATIQFVFNVYFWATNLASLSIIATTFMERVSFWSAYLIPTVVLAISMVPLLSWSTRLVRPPLQENVLPKALQVMLIACRKGFHLSAADPSHQANVPWDSKFINEMRRGLKACQVMLIFVIFWLCYNQMFNNIVSQAGQMELAGISNDTIVFLNVAAVVILSPIIQSFINLLRRYKIPFGPVKRMTIAFILTAMAMGYAAGLQKLIYSRGPCYSRPLDCPAAYADGYRRPNEVNVWLQTPIHVLLGAGEILGYVSMTEYAYSEAPPNMKAFVQALSQLTVALGSALGTALGPASQNPWLVILYSCLAAAMGVCAVIFFVVFRNYDKSYEEASAVADIEGDADV